MLYEVITDLDVTVDGFSIIPPMGTTSWVAFMPMERQAMIMGDLVLLEDEFRSVEQALIANSLEITAIHNHFLRDRPKVMFMHVGGSGDPLSLARALRAVLDEVSELRRAKGLVPRERVITSYSIHYTKLYDSASSTRPCVFAMAPS